MQKAVRQLVAPLCFKNPYDNAPLGGAFFCGVKRCFAAVDTPIAVPTVWSFGSFCLYAGAAYLLCRFYLLVLSNDLPSVF